MTLLPLLVPLTVAAVVDCCLESAMPVNFTFHCLPEPELLLSMDRDGCFDCSLCPQDWGLRGTELFLPGPAGILSPHSLECWAMELQGCRGPSAVGRCCITAEHLQPALKDHLHDWGPLVIWSACSPYQQVLLLHSLREKKGRFHLREAALSLLEEKTIRSSFSAVQWELCVSALTLSDG